MGDGLFELRPRGREGIARVFYCTKVGRKIIILHSFIKKTNETPKRELDIARRRRREVIET
jgi:phage-related protein